MKRIALAALLLAGASSALADSQPEGYYTVGYSFVHAKVADYTANLGAVQKGLSSDGFRGMVLCDQELRVRLFHNVLADYVDGRR